MNPQMLNSFLDGTKSAIEMAAIANATGLAAPANGLRFPPCGVDDLPHILRATKAGGVLEGVLTVGWAWGGEVIEARLGPKDMVLDKAGRPHGFRNDGVEPVLMSISVGTGMPKPPVYVCHPRDSDPQAARRFGAAPGKTLVFDPDSDDQRQQEFARHIVRYAERRPVWDAEFARMVYVGEGGAPPGQYRMDMVHLPKGAGVRGYSRPVEDAYFVVEGYITVGWEEYGHLVEERLGPKDVILNPAGRAHYFRNDGVTDAQFMLLVGTPRTEDVRFQPA